MTTQNTVKAIFPVLGMSCASCAGNTESTLKKQEGVLSAEVSYANSSAKIEFNPEITNPEILKKAVQNAGYGLIIDKSENSHADLNEIKDDNYKKLRKKVIGSIVLAIPLFIIGMFFMNLPYSEWIMWALSTPLVFHFGKQFFVGAYSQLKHKRANMDTLVALSTGTAYLYSVFVVLYSQFSDINIHSHVYFEAAGVVIAFILLGKLLEEKAKGNTGSALKKLIGIRPETATIVRKKERIDVPISQIKVGDIVFVAPGERIAVDGEVTLGSSYVDESSISGEPIPTEKNRGKKVFAGTINQKGNFMFVAEKVGEETVLSQIIKIVEEAQSSKASVQKLVDKIASFFVPIVLVIAILSFISWMILGSENTFSNAIISFVTVLVIACPCALGLATPTAIMVGVGKCAENGILIKDIESLEIAKKINAVVLDKTGTITEGKPSVYSMEWCIFDKNLTSDEIDNKINELQNVLYSAELNSEHPLAGAIVSFLSEKSKILENIETESIPGKGIYAIYNDKKFYVGNKNFIKSKNIVIPENVQNKIDEKLNKKQTVVLFSDETEILAIISISDKIKKDSKWVVEELHRKKISVYMLTGDNFQTAKYVAEKLNIKNFKAEVLPHEKISFIKELQENRKIVAMIGDGINDSGALAQADIGIAMGEGSDIAIDVSKMTIIGNKLSKILKAIDLSKKISKTIKQNLFWAFIYNVIGIPIAAGILFPINGFMLNPMLAGFAMAFSSVSVVINSLMLKFRN